MNFNIKKGNCEVTISMDCESEKSSLSPIPVEMDGIFHNQLLTQIINIDSPKTEGIFFYEKDKLTALLRSMGLVDLELEKDIKDSLTNIEMENFVKKVLEDPIDVSKKLKKKFKNHSLLTSSEEYDVIEKIFDFISTVLKDKVSDPSDFMKRLNFLNEELYKLSYSPYSNDYILIRGFMSIITNSTNVAVARSLGKLARAVAADFMTYAHSINEANELASNMLNTWSTQRPDPEYWERARRIAYTNASAASKKVYNS